MAKKTVRHARHAKPVKKAIRPRKDDTATLTVVRGWMFIVAFALMLGLGAVVGTYFNRLMNESTPTVAGASIELR